MKMYYTNHHLSKLQGTLMHLVNSHHFHWHFWLAKTSLQAKKNTLTETSVITSMWPFSLKTQRYLTIIFVQGIFSLNLLQEKMLDLHSDFSNQVASRSPPWCATINFTGLFHTYFQQISLYTKDMHLAETAPTAFWLSIAKLSSNEI